MVNFNNLSDGEASFPEVSDFLDPDLATGTASLRNANLAIDAAYDRIRQLRLSLFQFSEAMPSSSGSSRQPESSSSMGPNHSALMLSGPRSIEPRAAEPHTARSLDDIRSTLRPSAVERLEDFEDTIRNAASRRQASSNSPRQSSPFDTRPPSMSPLFPPLRRTLLERQLVRRQENSTDDSLTSRGRRVSARVQAGPSSASSGTIPRIRQRLFDRTQQIARDLEGIADRLAEREQGEHTPRPPRAALPADDPIPALIEDTQMMPPLPPIYFDHPPSHARAIDSAAERRFRAAVWQTSMPPPSTDERPILVDTTDRHASRRRDAQRFRNRRAAVFEITEANPDVQRSQTSSEWLLSSSQATEEDVPGESGHDVGTQANGPAENNEYSSQSFDDLDHTALEWLMNPLPLPRPHNPPHIARPTRIRVPHAGSARRPDTSGSEDTYVSDAGVTRQRRGWARLDRDGNEIPADEEAQLEGARARARMQALSEGRLTQSLSPHGGEMDPVRPPRREFRPTTRSSMVDSTRQPDVVRVRINSWRSARRPSSDEAAAMMAAAFASSETHSSAPREPINPLPMPLDAMVLSPRVPDPPRAIVVHEHSNFAGR